MEFIGKYAVLGLNVISCNVKNEFVNMLKRSTIKSAMCNLILQNMQNVRLKSYKLENGLNVTFIIGNSDYKLLQMAKNPLGFPRGFHIVWLDKIIACGTFVDKFENDERLCDSSDMKELFKTSKTIKIAKKFSGSLGLLTSFTHNNNWYVLFASKNSTGNEYTQTFHKLLKEYKIEQLLDDICSKYTIAFEVCAKNLGEHGATPINDIPVALLMCDTINNDNIKTVLSDEIAFHIFKKHSLPTEHRYIIDPTHAAFFDDLLSQRDDMTDTLFENITAKYDVPYTSGTFKHSTLNDVLEGLIIWIFDGRTTTIKKFKFPRYTVVTLGIRPYLTNKPNMHTHIKDFCDRWVITNKSYYAGLLAYVLPKLQTATDITYLHEVEPLIKQYEQNPMPIEYSSLTQTTNPIYHLYLIIGTIGSGKTTFAEKHTRYVGFDKHDETNNALKQTTTFGTIAYQLRKYNSVIVENGGGAFFNNNKLTIITKMAELLSCNEQDISVPIIVPKVVSTGLPNLIEITHKTVDQRFESGTYTTEFKSIQDAKTILSNVSTRNYGIITSIITRAKLSNMPIIEIDSTSEPLAITYSNNNVTETNYTYGFKCKCNDHKGHITLGYNKQVPNWLFDNANAVNIVKGEIVGIGSHKLLIIPEFLNTVCHSTMDTPYPAAMNGKITQDILNGATYVIANGNTYSVTRTEQVDVIVHTPYAYKIVKK